MGRTGVLLAGFVLAACSGQAPLVTSEEPAPDASDAAPPLGPGTVEDLVAYGQEHVDEFGGLYIDPPGGVSVVMLFTADLETHHEAVNRIVPGTRTRQVAHTEADLIALVESFDFRALQEQEIEMLTASVDVIGNKVELEVKTNDPTVELSLELAHGGMLDVTVHPLPGPWANVESGDGWRLVDVVHASGSEAYIVRAATDADSWTELWEKLGAGGGPPAADLDTEIVVSFAHGRGSACPELRLDGVVIGDGVVFSQTSDPLSPRGCTDDLVAAEVYVVALSRDALTDGGFTLQLHERSAGCCGDLDELDVHLP